MSTFAIALLIVVAFVVGQLLLLRPNHRETFLMGLRAEARKLGLQPRLLAPPDWYRGERPRGGLLACYSLLQDEDAPGLPYFRAQRLEDGTWVTQAGDASRLADLQLPEEAAALVALETQANTVSFWWKENLGPESLPALKTLLSQLLEKKR